MTIRILGMSLGNFVFVMYLTLQTALIGFVIWLGRREGLNWISMARTHRTYIRAVAHAIDMASDLGVICTLYTATIESSWFNSRRVAIFMIVIQLFYRLVSAYQVFRAARNLNTGDEWKVAFLQFADVLVFREVYNSFIERRMWPTQIMHQVRTLECVLESSPQIAVQLTYYLKTQAADPGSDANYFVLVSLILSFLSVSSIVLKTDDKSFTPRDWEPTERKAQLAQFNFRAPPTTQFLIRLSFRFLEILGRMSMIALLWMVLPGQVITVFLLIEIAFYFFLFEKGIIGTNWLSVLTFCVYHPNWTIACDQKLLTESKILKFMNLGLLNAEDYLDTNRRKSAIEGHVVAPVGLKQISTADELIADDLLGTEDMVETQTELHMKGSLALNRTVKESMTSVMSPESSPGARELSASGRESSFVLDSNPPPLVVYSVSPAEESKSKEKSKDKPKKKRHHSDMTGIKSSRSTTSGGASSPRSGSRKKGGKSKQQKQTKKGGHRKVESASLSLANRTSDKTTKGIKKIKPRLSSANSGSDTKPLTIKKSSSKKGKKKSSDMSHVSVISEELTDEVTDLEVTSPPKRGKKGDKPKKRKSGSLNSKRGSLTTMSLTLVNNLSKERLDEDVELSVSKDDSNMNELSQTRTFDDDEEDYDLDCAHDIAHDIDQNEKTSNNLGFFKGITTTLRSQNSGRGRGYSALLEAATKRSSDNRILIRSHYIHMFTKSLIYMMILNLCVWDNTLYNITYRKRGSDAIRNTSVVFGFYIFAMVSPFVQLLLFFGYLGNYANLPDPITLAKWCWIEGFESLVRNEPENVQVLAHAVDSKGSHMLYILMTTPLTNNKSKYRFTRGYGEVYEMTSYILRLGGNLEYLRAFYRNFNMQAKELVIRMAVYIVDLCLIRDKDDAVALRQQQSTLNALSHTTSNSSVTAVNSTSEEEKKTEVEETTDLTENNNNKAIVKAANVKKSKKEEIEEDVLVELGFNQYGLWTRMRRVRKPRAMLIAEFRQIMALFRSMRPSGNFDKKDCAKFFGYTLRAFNERLEVTSKKKKGKQQSKNKKSNNSNNMDDQKLLKKRETLMGNLIDPKKIAMNPVRSLFEQISYVCGNNPDTYDYLLSVFSLEFYQFLDAYTRFVLKHMDDVGAHIEDNHYFQSGIDAIVRCLTPSALSKFLTQEIVGGGARVIFDSSSNDSASKDYVVGKSKGVKDGYIINNIKRASVEKCVLCLTKRYNASFQPQFIEIPLNIGKSNNNHASSRQNSTIIEEDEATAGASPVGSHGFGSPSKSIDIVVKDKQGNELADSPREIPVSGEFEIKLRIQNSGSLKFDRGTKICIQPIGPASLVNEFKLKILNASDIRLDSLDNQQSKIFGLRIGYKWKLVNDENLPSMIYSLQNNIHYRIRVQQRSRNIGLFCVLKFKIDTRSLFSSFNIENKDDYNNLDADMACLIM